jgi:putative transposase
MNYKTNNNVMYSCKYHVVWCPKYRRKVLTGEISRRLKELIIQKCLEIKADIIEMEIMPDHVHLLIEIDPQFGINKAVRSIKGYSSHNLRKEFKSLTTRLPTLWTNSYFVSTVGGAPLDTIKQYVLSQKRSEARRKSANNNKNKDITDKRAKTSD